MLAIDVNALSAQISFFRSRDTFSSVDTMLLSLNDRQSF
jgi:hypothetical protein